MNMIQISDVIFLAHLAGFSELQQSLHNVSPKSVELKGQSKVLSEYHSQYLKFLEVVKGYNNLLNRDIQLMKQSGDALFEQDNLLGNILGK